jgi:hypothetical protein
MIVTLGGAVLTLRAGLALRRRRKLGARFDPDALRRHLRLAKPTLVLALLGFVAGPLSMGLLRGRSPFETAHAFLATLAVLLFVATALVGRRLKAGAGRHPDLHAALGVLALLASGAAAVAGFVLLP